jgi:hypothetical protein
MGVTTDLISAMMMMHYPSMTAVRLLFTAAWYLIFSSPLASPKWGQYGTYPFLTGSLSEPEPDMRSRFSRLYSLGEYDEDDPRMTGAARELLDDLEDLEKSVKDRMGLRTVSYRQRCKEAQKINRLKSASL